ncbi:MAG: RNase adapter RapZ [Acidimicrobiia bacterium]
MTDIVVIAGLSGAGRTAAAGVLEDLGWYVVDNLPTSLVEKIVELASAPGGPIDRLALVAGRQHAELVDKVMSLRAAGNRVRVLFLEAGTPQLVRRYESTKRRHPYATADDHGVLEAIELERAEVGPVKAIADLIIDTSSLNIHELKTRLVAAFGSDEPSAGQLQLAIESFGFKNGLPLDSDIVMDVRFLPNPYWVEGMRSLTGKDAPVREHVFAHPAAGEFLEGLDDLLTKLLPHYEVEGKSYLTVAIGCTGGRHRSVAVAEELARRLAARGFDPRVIHRDLPH